MLTDDGADGANTSPARAAREARIKAVTGRAKITPKFTYSAYRAGFAADVPEAALAALGLDADIASIIDDIEISLDPTESMTFHFAPASGNKGGRHMLAPPFQENECETIEDVCTAGICQDRNNGYACSCSANTTWTGTTCACNDGYVFNSDTKECDPLGDPVNECNDNPCAANAVCSDPNQLVSGDYVCTCQDGYQGDGVGSCVQENDQCNSTTCDTNATCFDTDKITDNSVSDLCTCNTGYTGDGTTCTALPETDECASTTCHTNATCFDTDKYTDNTPGICTCNDGFYGDGTTSCTEVTNYTDAIPWGITRVWGTSGQEPKANVTTTCSNGPCVWVLDTGVGAFDPATSTLYHPDININSALSETFISRTNSAADDGSHGSHVAGTIAAKFNDFGVVGVAPGQEVVAIKVLSGSGSGSGSGLIASLDYVATKVKSGEAGPGPHIVNMSLGFGGIYSPIDDQVKSMAQDGIIFALAAGNESKDASTTSPAAAASGGDDGIFSVSALNENDCISDFSNFGEIVRVGAPGVYVDSYVAPQCSRKYTDANQCTFPMSTYSGTSMAAPHVAGLLALGWGSSGSTLGDDTVKAVCGSTALRGVDDSSRDNRREHIAEITSSVAGIGFSSAATSGASSGAGVNLVVVGAAAGGVTLLVAVAGTVLVVRRARASRAGPTKQRSARQLSPAPTPSSLAVAVAEEARVEEARAVPGLDIV